MTSLANSRSQRSVSKNPAYVLDAFNPGTVVRAGGPAGTLTLGERADYAEQYVDTRLMPYFAGFDPTNRNLQAVNVEVTDMDLTHRQLPLPSWPWYLIELTEYVAWSHQWPCIWYTRTAEEPLDASHRGYGFQRSPEYAGRVSYYSETKRRRSSSPRCRPPGSCPGRRDRQSTACAP